MLKIFLEDNVQCRYSSQDPYLRTKVSIGWGKTQGLATLANCSIECRFFNHYTLKKVRAYLSHEKER